MATDTAKWPASFRVLAKTISGVTNIWLEGPLPGGKWMVAYRIVTSSGRPRVGEVRIFPSEPRVRDRRPGEWSGAENGIAADAPRRGLTNAVVKSVKVHQWLEHARDIIRTAERRARIAEPPFVIPDRNLPLPANVTFERKSSELERVVHSALLPRGTGQRRTGRPRKRDLFYATIAKQYENAVRRPGLGPVQRLARKRRQSPAIVRGLIYRARRYGYLSAGEQGVAHGTLTEKGLKILLAARAGQRRKSPATRRRRP